MNRLEELTDEELVAEYVNGSNKAFDILLARNQSKFFSYILFVVRDQDAANDIFQETFIKYIHMSKIKMLIKWGMCKDFYYMQKQKMNL